MGHAEFSPSASKRWLACTASIEACRGLTSPDNVHSARGTFGHGIAAECLLKGKAAREFLGVRGNVAGFDFEFDEKLAGAVQLYVDVVEGLELLGGALHVERPVKLDPNVYGTADAILVFKDEDGRQHIHVIDLKLGSGDFVEAERNTQLMIYALAFLAEHGLEPSHVGSVTLHIVQPLHHASEPHRQWAVPLAELAEFKRQVFAAVVEAKSPRAKFVPGSHCYYCPKRGDCAALAGQALATAQDVFEDLDTLKPKAKPDLTSYTPERLAALLDAVPVVEQWVAAIYAHAEERLNRGQAIPGWKLVEKIGNRKWLDELKAAAVLKQQGVDPYEHTVISPAQAEKRGGKSIKPLVAQLTERPVTGTKIARVTDSAPELKPGTVFDLLD